jgi:hypothetical protein
MNGRLSSKALTGELRRLAVEVIPSNDPSVLEGQTREQLLADLIWKQALGWTEITRDDEGTLLKKVHPPVAWAQQYLFERIEGKAPVATADVDGGMKAADKVRELARDRINALTAVKAGPPSHKPKK